MSMTRRTLATALGVLIAASLYVGATSVPLVLPQPDGNAGDATRPVKVYLLAGQSNMVGFGQLSGARPAYASIFLSADPAIVPGRLVVGRAVHYLTSHGVYPSADPKAWVGGMAMVYSGAYDPEVDYERLPPTKVASVNFGTVAEDLPSIDGPHVVVVRTFVDVPASGTYTLHAGYGDSTHCIVALEEQEVYRKDIGGQPVIEKVSLEAGRRYPVRVTYLKGGSMAFWLEQTELEGKGDLQRLTTKEGKFPWMIDTNGHWTVRNDVTYSEARIAEDGRWEALTATSNGKFIGPEVPFGYVMGTYHDEQVLLIETSMGNRGLWWDFRPPSSGKTDSEGFDKWEGLEYRLMVKGVRTILNRIDEVVPGYSGQGYEIAGFAWWQGHKDGGAGQSQAEYEQHLTHLIRDVRKEFDAPDMRAVVATVGFGGYQLSKNDTEIWKAQMAVGDASLHPEFAGSVASVDTRGYWRAASESPTGTGYHYNHNAETYMLTGDALGRAMVALLGGEVEMPPVPEPLVSADVAPVEAANEQLLAASKAASIPLIVDGMLATHLSNPGTQAALATAAKGERPKRANQFLRDTIDGLNLYYHAVGIRDYDWKDFGPDMGNATWDYYSFDPAELKDRASGHRYRSVTLPDGMDHWFAPDFDAAAVRWTRGQAPFGQKGGERVALGSCDGNMCRCGVPPKTLWEHEVLLMRQTFDVPPLKEGHRYRLVVGGSAHVNAGDGYALYVDGKLLAESNAGVGKRQGGAPRGGHVYADVLPAFEDGKITIALKSFLRYNHPRIKPYPPSGHLSVWLEEQKLPPLGE